MKLLVRDLRRPPRHGRLPRTREAADKGSEKATDAWETTRGLPLRELRRLPTLWSMPRRREANKPCAYGGSLRRLLRRVQEWPATHGRPL